MTHFEALFGRKTSSPLDGDKFTDFFDFFDFFDFLGKFLIQNVTAFRKASLKISLLTF